MRRQDIEVGRFYLAQTSKYSGPADAVLMLSLDPTLGANSSYYSQTATVFRRRIASHGLPKFVGLRVLPSSELYQEMDAWADGGPEPAIVRGRDSVVNHFDAFVSENVADASTSAEVPADLFSRETRLALFTSRDLLGPWVETRGPQLAAERENKRRDAEAREAAAKRADAFVEMAALAKTLGFSVDESNDYHRTGQLSYTNARVPVTELMSLLAEVRESRKLHRELFGSPGEGDHA